MEIHGAGQPPQEPPGILRGGGGQHSSAVLAQLRRHDRALVAQHSSFERGADDGPEPDRVAAQREEAAAIGAQMGPLLEHDASVMHQQRAYRLAGLGVPEANRVVRGGRQQPSAVPAEAPVPHLPLVPNR